MSEVQSAKAQLRASLRQQRNCLSPSAQSSAAQALLDSIAALPHWATARRVAVYLAANGEIATEPLAELARNLGKDVFLPVIGADHLLDFAHWRAGEALSINRYRIPEPPRTATRCPVAELDIIFLPVVGWDRYGGRLGMGGGFYDRTLARISGPLLVGLAHGCQEVEEIPLENWDIRLDFIATDIALHPRREHE